MKFINKANSETVALVRRTGYKDLSVVMIKDGALYYVDKNFQPTRMTATNHTLREYELVHVIKEGPERPKNFSEEDFNVVWQTQDGSSYWRIHNDKVLYLSANEKDMAVVGRPVDMVIGENWKKLGPIEKIEIKGA